MESDLGKLFIGGISWDTDEERLRDYFSKYGDVVEAVIMRDRATGRARGFGFIVFADLCVAERVIMEKHIIDGRTVSYTNPLLIFPNKKLRSWRRKMQLHLLFESSDLVCLLIWELCKCFYIVKDQLVFSG